MTNVSGETLSPLLDQFDAKTADDTYLRAIAEEYVELMAASSRTEAQLGIARKYDEGMGIVWSNNMHLWFNDRPVDPNNPFSEVNNINNPRFSSWPGVQGLLVLREQEPDLFKEIGKLSKEQNILMRHTMDNALGRTRLSDDEERELDISGAMVGFKLDLAKTRAIKLLQEMGVSDEALLDLYR